MAVGVEYIRDVLAASPTGPRTASAFLEGQTEATNIAANQLRQQQAEQAMRYAEMQQPYVMAGLERARQAGDIQLQEERAAIERANKAYGLQPDFRGGAVAPVAGRGLMPGIAAPVAPASRVAPELLAPTPMGGQAGGFDYATYASRMLPAEGTGRNVRSTAQGPGQFIDSTFIDTFKKTFPESARAMSDAQILAQRGTGVETAMLKKFTEDNITALTSAGIQPTMANAYIAHFLGIGGAQNVLTKPADTPIEQVVDRAAIAANPSVFNKVRTVGDLEAWAAGKMGELSTAGVQERKAAAFREQYPIAYALGKGRLPAAPVQPVTPAPAAGLAAPAPAPVVTAPAGIQEPGKSIVGEIVRQPVGAEPITVNTKELLEPLRLQQETSQLNATLRFYETEYQRAALLRDPTTMRAIGEKMVQMQPVANMLTGMQALTEFSAGRPEAVANLLYQRTGGRLRIQPRSDGTYNVYDGDKLKGEGLTKDYLTAQFRMAFDQDYKAQVSEAIKTQQAQAMEVFKSGLKRAEEYAKGEAGAAGKLVIERFRAAVKAANPDAAFQKVDENKVLVFKGTQPVGTATVEQELDPATGQPVFWDPATKQQPKSIMRFTPATQ